MEPNAVGELIVGFFLPLVFAFVVKQTWDAGVKQIVTFVLYFVASVAVYVVEQQAGWLDGYEWREMVSLFATIVVGGLAGYFGLWRRTVGEKIEAATS